MNVIVVDDYRMMRDGLRALLENAGIKVVAEAGDGYSAVAEAKRWMPDVVLMDIAMPMLNGIDATRQLTAELPGVKVIALSMNGDRRYIMAMLAAGAVGYLRKSAASEELLTALASVSRGETYLSPGIAHSVVQEAIEGAAGSSRRPSEKPLSTRERGVVQLVAEGKSSKEIATVLNLAVSTIETHRRQIMDKLDLRSIAGLTKYAIREGLTSADG